MKKLNFTAMENCKGGICMVFVTPGGAVLPICFPAPCWAGSIDDLVAAGFIPGSFTPNELACPA